MSKSLVTESPEELVSKAEKDVMTVNVLSAQEFYPEDLMYDVICFHATQAVEKLLKGFIINNGKTVEKMHNLDVLQKTAMEIDALFTNISKECVALNEYVPDIKYSEQEPITKQNIINIIKSMNAICDFPPIKAMCDSFSKDRKCEIVSEITTGQKTNGALDVPQKSE